MTNLTSHPSYPGHPDRVRLLPQLELGERFGDFYGLRTRGWLLPPQTGDYHFWIAADDDAELWLSSDETPEHKSRVCFTPEWTRPRKWDAHPEQASEAVRLDQTRRYYVEVLMKQSAGGEELSVAWSEPGLERAVVGRQYLAPCPAPARQTSH